MPSPGILSLLEAGDFTPGTQRIYSPMTYQAGQVVRVTATDVAHGGWCVARPEDGPVVFVRHALPGETVMARITEVTSRLARAEAVDIVTPSPDRVEPPCPHARPGGCGGCDWQHATLPAQREVKAAVIRQQLRRLAGLDREVTVEALPGDEGPGDGKPDAGLGWRTRVQYAVGPDGSRATHQPPWAASPTSSSSRSTTFLKFSWREYPGRPSHLVRTGNTVGGHISHALAGPCERYSTG